MILFIKKIYDKIHNAINGITEYKAKNKQKKKILLNWKKQRIKTNKFCDEI